MAVPLNITVLCPFGNMNVITVPAMSSDNVIILATNTQITIEVDLLSGSFVNYRFRWGDGNVDIVNNSMHFKPRTLVQKHRYETIGNYVLNILAFNNLYSIDKTFTISVLKCVPLVQMSGMSKASPIYVTRSESYVIKADYFYVQDSCEKLMEPLVTFRRWLVTKNGIEEYQTTKHLNKSRLFYEIKPFSLQTGLHSVLLAMQWLQENKPVVVNHTSYINIVDTSLRAIIKNGEVLTLPWKVGANHKAMSWFNFTLDGTTSLDTKNLSADIRNISALNNDIKYSWSCRLLHGNKSFGENCLTDNFDSLDALSEEDSATGVLRLSSFMFKEGFSYEIKMAIAKGNEKDHTSVSITFLKGDLPVLQTR